MSGTFQWRGCFLVLHQRAVSCNPFESICLFSREIVALLPPRCLRAWFGHVRRQLLLQADELHILKEVQGVAVGGASTVVSLLGDLSLAILEL